MLGAGGWFKEGIDSGAGWNALHSTIGRELMRSVDERLFSIALQFTVAASELDINLNSIAVHQESLRVLHFDAHIVRIDGRRESNLLEHGLLLVHSLHEFGGFVLLVLALSALLLVLVVIDDAHDGQRLIGIGLGHGELHEILSGRAGAVQRVAPRHEPAVGAALGN